MKKKLIILTSIGIVLLIGVTVMVLLLGDNKINLNNSISKMKNLDSYSLTASFNMSGWMGLDNPNIKSTINKKSKLEYMKKDGLFNFEFYNVENHNNFERYENNNDNAWIKTVISEEKYIYIGLEKLFNILNHSTVVTNIDEGEHIKYELKLNDEKYKTFIDIICSVFEIEYEEYFKNNSNIFVQINNEDGYIYKIEVINSNNKLNIIFDNHNKLNDYNIPSSIMENILDVSKYIGTYKYTDKMQRDYYIYISDTPARFIAYADFELLFAEFRMDEFKIFTGYYTIKNDLLLLNPTIDLNDDINYSEKYEIKGNSLILIELNQEILTSEKQEVYIKISSDNIIEKELNNR